MDSAIRIREGIYWIGVNDRITQWFEGLWPLPRGVSYNAYIVDDEKVALFDTVKSLTWAEYVEKVEEVVGPDRQVDYLVVHHLEPDHSGSIRQMIDRYPNIQIIGNAKTAEFLKELYGVEENVRIIQDGDTIDLGRRKVQFFLTPMLHWPETMMSWLAEDGVLLSGDAFGVFGALNGGVFDDTVDADSYYEEGVRYFSNIIGKYAPMVQKNMKKLAGLDVKVIAPLHGPVWRANPAKVLGWYDRWSRQEAEEGLVIAYGSMYDNTKRLVEAVAQGASEGGVENVIVHNVTTSHFSYIVRDVWRYRGLALAAPAYDAGLFPLMRNLTNVLEGKRVAPRPMGIFGTYGWSGGSVSALKEFAAGLKMDLVEPIVEARFGPKADDIDNAYKMGRALAEKIKA